LNLKSFAQVELNYCHRRDGLRPASIADANDEGASRTGHQFGELTTRA
jgi:thiamine biosynthesis protein ThiC